jgi:hypothetical protein
MKSQGFRLSAIFGATIPWSSLIAVYARFESTPGNTQNMILIFMIELQQIF